MVLETLAINTDKSEIKKTLPKKTGMDLIEVFGEPSPLVVRDVEKRKQLYLKRNPSNDWSDFVPFHYQLQKKI